MPRRVWTTQPPAGTPIDWDNPLSTGLLYAYNGSSGSPLGFDSTRKRAAAVLGTAYPLASSAGAISVGWGGAGSAVLPRDVTLEPPEVTVAAYIRRTGTLAAQAGIVVKAYQNSTSSCSYGLFLNYLAAGQNYAGMQVYTGVNKNARNNVTNSAEPTLLIGVAGTAGVFLYQGASQIASLVTDVSLTYDTTTTGNLVLAGCSGASVTQPFTGDIYSAYVWGRAFDADSVERFAANQWQLYWKRRRTYSVPASTGASGSAAITEGADATLATGTLSVSGSAAVAEAADPSSGAGNIGDAATAAITEPADGVAATGALSVAGSATINEAADTGTGTGATGDAATAAIAEPSDAAVATGALSVTGSASIAEGADASTGAGALGTGATAAITEGADAIAGTGALSVAGLAAILEGGDIIVATGAAGSGATASIAEGADTIAGVGGISVDGTGVVAEGADLTSGTGAAGAGAHGAIAEEGDAVAASGSITIPGAMALLEGDDLAGAFGALGLIGSALITEGADTVYGMSAPPPDAACTLGAILINRSTLQIAAARSAISLTANLSTIRVLQ